MSSVLVKYGDRYIGYGCFSVSELEPSLAQQRCLQRLLKELQPLLRVAQKWRFCGEDAMRKFMKAHLFSHDARAIFLRLDDRVFQRLRLFLMDGTIGELKVVAAARFCRECCAAKMRRANVGDMHDALFQFVFPVGEFRGAYWVFNLAPMTLVLRDLRLDPFGMVFGTIVGTALELAPTVSSVLSEANVTTVCG